MTISIDDIVVRLTVAFVIGALLGLERTVKRKSAGIKTHTVICIVSTMVTIVSMYGLPGSVQPSRILANILLGVGFLGAGIIFSVVINTKKTIKGLTTAAEIWGAACIGIPIGLGAYKVVVISLGLIFLALRADSAVKLIERFNNKIKTKKQQ